MKNKLLYVLVLLCLCSLSFAQVTPEYSSEPDETYDKTDLTLFGDNTFAEYENLNLDLPPYIPHSVWSKLKRNNATRSRQIIGRHVPRFFDGEKYTDFRADGFNPDNLTSAERAQMDSISIYVQHEMQQGGSKNQTCDITAFLQTAKRYSTPGLNSSDDITMIYEVPYAYDMGYFYVPEIRDAFAFDCNNILAGSEWSSRDLMCSLAKQEVTGFFEDFANIFIDVYNNDTSADSSMIDFYGAGSYLVAYDPYDTLGEGTTLQEPCVVYSGLVSGNTVSSCFSEQNMEYIYSLIDVWMYKFLNGLFFPTTCSEALNELLETDPLFSKCYDKISNLPQWSSYLIFLGTYGQREKAELESCMDYVEEKRDESCSLPQSYDLNTVQNLIWNHYRSTYKIKKGTNLFPFNVERSLIRCHPNAVWQKITFDDYLLPNRQSPTIFCDYSNFTETVIPIEFKFVLKHNPVWATVVGANGINNAYDTAFWQYMFSMENYLGADFVNVTVEDFNQYFAISSTFNVNRSQTDGCFVYMNLSQAGQVTGNIDEGITQAQENAENVADALIEQRSVQLSLLRSEVEKLQLFSFLEFLAEMFFRAYLALAYIVSLALFFYALKLIPDAIRAMTNNIKNLGTSKYKKEESLLNDRG